MFLMNYSKLYDVKKFIRTDFQFRNNTISVMLKSVDLSTSGSYQCGVTADAQSFETATVVIPMIVVGGLYRDGKRKEICPEFDSYQKFHVTVSSKQRNPR